VTSLICYLNEKIARDVLFLVSYIKPVCIFQDVSTTPPTPPSTRPPTRVLHHAGT